MRLCQVLAKTSLRNFEITAEKLNSRTTDRSVIDRTQICQQVKPNLDLKKSSIKPKLPNKLNIETFHFFYFTYNISLFN